MSAKHPAPSAMARERYGSDNLSHMSVMRSAFADGVAAERTRIVAWLRAEHEPRFCPCPDLNLYASELEGK